jgi:hypothetical protein
MLERLYKEMQDYIEANYARVEDIDILVGKDSPEVIVIFGCSSDVPGTLFEGIWDKNDNTITIAEYQRDHEEFIYVD